MHKTRNNLTGRQGCCEHVSPEGEGMGLTTNDFASTKVISSTSAIGEGARSRASAKCLIANQELFCTYNRLIIILFHKCC